MFSPNASCKNILGLDGKVTCQAVVHKPRRVVPYRSELEAHLRRGF